MLKWLYPYEYAESVFTIDYRKLYSSGYRGILFDIDNTLVPHGAGSTPQVDELFRELHEIGFGTLLLSNNDEERIRMFMENIDSLYICDANKPERDGYLRGVEMLGIRKEEAIVIGDQVFTDIFGANRCGLASILVKYIGYYKKERKGIRRNLEKIILALYGISHSCRHRLGDILTEGRNE